MKVEEISEKEKINLCFEEYELRFVHNYVDEKGVRHKADEPIISRYMVVMERQDYIIPKPYIFNELFEKIRDYMLNRLGERE